MKKFIFLILISIVHTTISYAKEQVVDLHVGYKKMKFTGVVRKAIAVNNQIPGPTLRFKEGDIVTIRVHNHLTKGTSIHWHGILLPWQMDGVDDVSQKEIDPGKTFQYKFELKQSGTYWYHAHQELEEQQGLYGAFIVEPKNNEDYQYSKDFPIVLSDWSNTYPEKVLKNLKKTGEYYQPRLPMQPSLKKFLTEYYKSSKIDRSLVLEDYLTMQQTRLNFYSFSSVAYDAFLLNGLPNQYAWQDKVVVGDVVRLRFICAGASTIFNVKIPETNMQVVQVQGNNVEPYNVDKLTIAPGETYDVLVKIKKDAPYIIYAESLDTLGAAYGALVTNPKIPVDYKSVQPFPKPLPQTRQMTKFLSEIPSKARKNKSKAEQERRAMRVLTKTNSSLHIPLEPTISDDKEPSPSANIQTSTGTQYQPLKAAVKTNDPNKPIESVIHMELFGYMERFVWFINGVPDYVSKPIVLKANKRYRVVFNNISMMYTPMQIHGHWFILRKGQGEYDPLLHTVNVPPGATITVDVDTDASGQWLFNYHMLYHMMGGMSRVFQYSTLLEIVKDKAKPENVIEDGEYKNRPIIRVDEARPIDKQLVKNPLPHPEGFWLASFLDIGADPFKNVQRLTYKGLYGSDFHKLELFTNDAELSDHIVENADIDIMYWHLISQFWAIKAGVNYMNRPAERPYWQASFGIEGVAPFFIEADARFYVYSGSLKLDLELTRNTQITNNLFLRTALRTLMATRTVERAVIGSGLNQMRYIVRPYYRIIPGLNAFIEYEHEQDYGDYKILEGLDGELRKQNTVTIGVSAIL
ncbi:MAG: multicopper oxidase domain-containing protein [Legionellaceae bacterium]|nr:multicopper oxidase domain-containing protein [Legionellaceae bacterium]